MDSYLFGPDWSPKYPNERVPRGLYFGEWMAAACPSDTIAGVTFTATLQGGASDLDLTNQSLAVDNPMVVIADCSGGSVGDHLVTVTITTGGGYIKSVEMTQTVAKP